MVRTAKLRAQIASDKCAVCGGVARSRGQQRCVQDTRFLHVCVSNRRGCMVQRERENSPPQAQARKSAADGTHQCTQTTLRRQEAHQAQAPPHCYRVPLPAGEAVPPARQTLAPASRDWNLSLCALRQPAAEAELTAATSAPASLAQNSPSPTMLTNEAHVVELLDQGYTKVEGVVPDEAIDVSLESWRPPLPRRQQHSVEQLCHRLVTAPPLPPCSSHMSRMHCT